MGYKWKGWARWSHFIVASLHCRHHFGHAIEQWASSFPLCLLKKNCALRMIIFQGHIYDLQSIMLFQKCCLSVAWSWWPHVDCWPVEQTSRISYLGCRCTCSKFSWMRWISWIALKQVSAEVTGTLERQSPSFIPYTGLGNISWHDASLCQLRKAYSR